jgi:hypothetical protein
MMCAASLRHIIECRCLARSAAGATISRPFCISLDDEGNVDASEYGNHRIQVIRNSDGTNVSTFGLMGRGDV